MEVTDIIKMLIKVQKFENEIAVLSKQKDKLPLQLKSTQLKVDDELDNLKNYNGLIAKCQNAIKASEHEVSKVNQRINDVKKQQSESKSNKEFQTFTEVIDKYKVEIDAQEDIEIKMLEEIENLEKETAKISERVDFLKQQLQAREKELDENFNRLDSEIKTLRQSEAEILAQIPTDVKEQFEKLIQLRKGIAVCPVEVITIEDGGSCTGCGTQLIRPIVQRLLAQNEIVACPACSRILYLLS